ncbi:MAG: hypothetical protein U1E38_05830 [Rhodospirillales bacterium]
MTKSGVVLFLGAGFSKSIDGTMPTDKELLDKVRHDEQVPSRTRELINSLLKYVSDDYGNRLELLLSMIQRLRSQKDIGRTSQPSAEKYDSVWRDIVASITRATYFKPDKSYYDLADGDDNFGKFIRNLKKIAHKDHISIVTTNYDLIADKAALHLMDDCLCHDKCGRQFKYDLRRYQYGYPIRKLYTRNSHENVLYVPWHTEKRASVYKLHGSTNWAYCPYCKNLDLAESKEDMDRLQNPTERAPCSECGCYYDRIIIPPVPNKGGMNKSPS